MFKGFSFAKIVAPREYKRIWTAILLFFMVPFFMLFFSMDNNGILTGVLLYLIIMQIVCSGRIESAWESIEKKRQAYFLFLQFTGDRLEGQHFGFDPEEEKIFRYGTIYYLNRFLDRQSLPFRLEWNKQIQEFYYFVWNVLQRSAGDIQECRNDFWYRKKCDFWNYILKQSAFTLFFVFLWIRVLILYLFDGNMGELQKLIDAPWKPFVAAIIIYSFIFLFLASRYRIGFANTFFISMSYYAKRMNEKPFLPKTHEQAFLLMLGKSKKEMERFKGSLPDPEQFNLMERLIFEEELSQTQWIADFLMKENPALSAEEAERLAKQYDDSISKKVRDAKIQPIELWNIWSPYYFYDDKDNLTSRLLTTPYYSEASKKLRS